MLLLRCTSIHFVIMRISAELAHQKGPPFVTEKDESFLFHKDRKISDFGGLLSVAKTETENDNCGLTFDAATNFRDELYFIKGTKFWRVRANYQVYKGTKLQHLWSGLPTNISKVDAVFTLPADQSIVFISGNFYWILADPRGEPTKMPISALGIHDQEQIRGAFVWSVNDRIYIIGTSKYWQLGEDLRLEPGYPRDLSGIKGLPRDVDGAFEDFDRQVYFMQGSNAWKLNNDKVEVGDVTDISTRWLGCTTSTDVEVTTASFSDTAISTTAGVKDKKLDVSIFGCGLLSFIYIATYSIV